MKEAGETIEITMEMVREGEEEDVEDEVAEEIMDKKEARDNKANIKAEDNIEVEEEAEDIAETEVIVATEAIVEIEVIAITKKAIEEVKRRFIRIKKLESCLRTRSKLRLNKFKIKKVHCLLNSGQYSKKEAELKGMMLGNFRNKPKV